MIRVTTAAGLPVKLFNGYRRGKFVLTTRGIVGEVSHHWGLHLKLSYQYDVNTATWKEGPREKPKRRYMNSWTPGKRFTTVYAWIDTEEEAIRVAETMSGAKVGTHDFKLKLALISDETINIEDL